MDSHLKKQSFAIEILILSGVLISVLPLLLLVTIVAPRARSTATERKVKLDDFLGTPALHHNISLKLAHNAGKAITSDKGE